MVLSEFGDARIDVTQVGSFAIERERLVPKADGQPDMDGEYGFAWWVATATLNMFVAAPRYHSHGFATEEAVLGYLESFLETTGAAYEFVRPEKSLWVRPELVTSVSFEGGRARIWMNFHAAAPSHEVRSAHLSGPELASKLAACFEAPPVSRSSNS